MMALQRQCWSFRFPRMLPSGGRPGWNKMTYRQLIAIKRWADRQCGTDLAKIPSGKWRRRRKVMKVKIILGIVAALVSFSTHGQGTILFNNRVAGRWMRR